MERIGIAASKIAKGNFFLYNFFVFLISFLFGFLVFFISGSSIIVVLVLIAYFTSPSHVPDLQKGWVAVMTACMICLAVVVMFFTLCAVFKNIKFHKSE